MRCGSMHAGIAEGVLDENGSKVANNIASCPPGPKEAPQKWAEPLFRWGLHRQLEHGISVKRDATGTGISPSNETVY